MRTCFALGAAVVSLLTALSSAAAVPLFDGKTLNGWEGDLKMWRVEEGAITGGSLQEKVAHNDFIATKKSYANFDLRLKIKLTGTEGFINSGVQIRSVRVPGSPEMSGYQVDYGKGWYGKIYDESRRNKVIAQASDLKAVNAAIKEGDWNEYRIRAEGPRIQTWVNGVPALDYTEADPNIAQDGRIGIQVHGGGKAKVQVKEISIEELPPTPNAPTWEKVGKPKGAAANVKPGGRDISHNAVRSAAKTPAEERACFALPEGFEAQLVAAESEGVGKFVPIAFDQRGALWTTTAFEYPVDGNENPAAADALYASKARDKVLVFDRDAKSPTGYVSKPRVFADGLAIPLGVLPYKNGCYVQHGHDIVFLDDTDADGKADKRTVILTGFGVQDSHLFPHQFMRAPGGWIWMAQGAFNYSKVRRPDQPAEKAVQFDQTRMAKFRPDGTGFTITSNGPCNIWGLVLNGEGEAFIQEANDFGYPVMPFHEYANYPGCSDRQWKSYAPEFPGTAPDFRMGGTGLSGLALTDKNGPFPEPWRDLMFVANPITNRIQAIKMHRDGPYWKLDRPKDFLVSSDPWFRPVAISVGPDGCLYIVDWYNKIISHNEVPRNHPDRDKTRGRIWRIVPTGQKPFEVPDFTKLSGDELIAKLGGESLAQSHLAWQALADRTDLKEEGTLGRIFESDAEPDSKRIQALWALAGREQLPFEMLARCFASKNRNLRRQGLLLAATSAWPCGPVAEEFAKLGRDEDPEVRAEFVKWVAQLPSAGFHGENLAMSWLLNLALEPLNRPTAPSTRNRKPIKVRAAYDREFERYLVRMFLERQPTAVAAFLDSTAAERLPVEARLLASLALDPKASAQRVAKLLPLLDRAPGQEEVLRLAQFPEEPGVGEALRAGLTNAATRVGVAEALLATRTRLDDVKLRPMLAEAASELLSAPEAKAVALGAQLAGAFQLRDAEGMLVDRLKREPTVSALNALAEIGSNEAELFEALAKSSKDDAMRNAALWALASSRATEAGTRLLKLWPLLDPVQRRNALARLTSTKTGAKAVVGAVQSGSLEKEELDGSAAEKLQAVLGDDAELAGLFGELASLFRPVLALNGKEDAWTQTGVTLEGPFTVETWVRLDPAAAGRKAITNDDGILGAPGQLDMNFYGAKFRVWVGGGVHDAIVSKKPVMPGLWTHLAVTRDAHGFFKLYQDGELAADQSKPALRKFENVRIGWAQPKGGTSGALDQFRIWNRARTAGEIRRDFDRGLDPMAQPSGLVFNASGSKGWGKLQPGATVVRTSDFPPVLNSAEAAALDAKFVKYRALAEHGGDATRGSAMAAVCQACHLFKGKGVAIGPDLSGVGAMGTEAILRNILTPNAAMENAYRIYRVELKSGDVLDTFFVSEDDAAVVVRQAGAADRRIPKPEIRQAKYLRRSLMPEGLIDALQPEQVRDLFAYLRTMK